MKMITRETAWRIFAGEYNSSTHIEISAEERAPSYVITPLGAKINRLLVVGVITDVENIGTDTEPMWRARLADPTGVFYISAGQYQPEAAQVLSKIKPPKFVAVIGKSRTYSPEEGVIYVSIRPETVKEVNSQIRDYWIMDACRNLQKRLDIMGEALRMEKPEVENIISLGASRNNAEGILSAIEHYDYIDIARFNGMLQDALKCLLPEYQDIKSEKITEAEGQEEPESPEGNLENENLFMEIIEALDTNVKGASWEEIVEKAEKKGMNKMQIEEATNSLLDKGLIYEPVLGRIKKI
ncbi:MAG: glycerol dehydrogenase [Methanomassiliicoccales archaeon]|nr:MAG: glycerol dehydrogenase [Methanomassiliicoccales archaeon]